MDQKCSIIIPHRNQPERLASCLDRLLELGYGNHEIIVVENSDSVPDFLERYPVIICTTNKFPSPYVARNIGIERASKPIITLLDVNCLVEKGWLDSGLQELEENCIVSGVPIKPDPEKINNWQKFDYLYSSFSDLNTNELKALPAGNLFFYKSAWISIGRFPEVRSLGDMLWTGRASSEGYKLKIAGNSKFKYSFKSKKSFLAKYRRIGFGMGENRFVLNSKWYIIKNVLPPSPAFVKRFWKKNNSESMGLNFFEIVFFCWCVKLQYAKGYFKYVTKG
ncbi:glycosyltransferase family 2 protein [Membranihabitans maritimus]|uniref:glycosyltransferase family 2 protein n=1 Tax=Membranihabitans maritimus TaxID=2904244 RepID=UPI001F2E0789|nr:glycosyltransferase family A protein [Membranihabitans maritimus]